MFLEKYLDEFYYKEVIDNYYEDYLCNLDESNFLNVYNLLTEYGFYYINDIILNYIEIFTMDVNKVKDKIIELSNDLGDNFVNIIGNDMTYLNNIIDV